MREAFLQFVWQQQLITPSAMTTTSGHSVVVMKAGSLNTYSGPDFSNAQIRIDGMVWFGAVEIHYRSSDWQAHTHHQDQAYEQVILHVVWHHDKEIYLTDGTALPTLTLAGSVPQSVIDKYQGLLQVPAGILPCQPYLQQLDRLTKINMLDHALWLRLHRKALLVQDLLISNQYDWETTIWQWLAQAFGFKANSAPMLLLAQQVPLKIIRKHSNIPRHIEALLLGFAGWLDIGPELEEDPEPTDQLYAQQLRQDWDWLRTKFNLTDKVMISSLWKTGGLRPGNHPVTRIVQLAALVTAVPSLFNLIGLQQDKDDLSQMMDLDPDPHADFYQADGSIKVQETMVTRLAAQLTTSPSPYWQRHSSLGKPCKPHNPAMGQQSVDTILVNTLAPLMVAYGQHQNQGQHTHLAMSLLESLPAESNAITRFWAAHQLPLHTAFDTQAAIELKTQFCDQKRCLNCRIGQRIVGRDKVD